MALIDGWEIITDLKNECKYIATKIDSKIRIGLYGGSGIGPLKGSIVQAKQVFDVTNIDILTIPINKVKMYGTNCMFQELFLNGTRVSYIYDLKQVWTSDMYTLDVSGINSAEIIISTRFACDYTTLNLNNILEFESQPVTEGNLQITQIVIKDIEVFPTPNPVFMYEGEKADFNIKVKNLGADDHFKFEVWADEGEGEYLAYGVEFDCPADVEDWIFPGPGLILTMGNKDAIVICKTFHLEEAGWVQDDVPSFTITLALEGIADLKTLMVYDDTTGMMYQYAPGGPFGDFIPIEPEGTEGHSMRVYVEMKNIGAEDILYCGFVSPGVTPDQGVWDSTSSTYIQESATTVPNDGVTTFNVEWTFIMPPNDVYITTNQGHLENGGPVSP